MPTEEVRARNRAHKMARKMYPALDKCETCGATEKLERHHPDYSQPTRIEVLCRSCHRKADQRDGYARTKSQRACALCGHLFFPTHSKNHRTCSPQCLSEIGRRNAAKRWQAYYRAGRKPKRIRGCPVNAATSGPSRTVFLAESPNSVPSGTRSCRNVPTSSAVASSQ